MGRVGLTCTLTFVFACEGYRLNTPMIEHKSAIEHLSIYYLLFIFVVIFMVMGLSSECLKYLFELHTQLNNQEKQEENEHVKRTKCLEKMH